MPTWLIKLFHSLGRKQAAKVTPKREGITQIPTQIDAEGTGASFYTMLREAGFSDEALTKLIKSEQDIIRLVNKVESMGNQRRKIKKGVEELAEKPPFQGFTPTIVKDKTLFKDSPERIAKMKADNKAAIKRLKEKTTKNVEPIVKSLDDDVATAQINKLKQDFDFSDRKQVLQLFDDIDAGKAFGSFDEVQKKELRDMISTMYTKKPDFASGGIAGQLHLNRPGYSSGALVKLLNLFKGVGKKGTGKYVPYSKDYRVDMKKLMKGDKPIKLFSGQTKRASNMMESFKKDAEFFKTTPEKIAKGKFKDQWFTPYRDYAEAFYNPSDLTATMRTVELTPKEIAMAKRYVKKMNKLDTYSRKKMLGLEDPPKINLTLDDNTVIIPRIKLKKLKKEGRLKTDYRIPEKIKAKLGITSKKDLQYKQGGRIGYAQGTTKPGERYYLPTKGKEWLHAMPEIDPYKKFFRRKNKLMKFKDSKGLAEILGV